MIYFEITTGTDKIIAGNMGSFMYAPEYREQKNFSAHQKGVGCRGVFNTHDDGVGVWVVVENEKDLLKSTSNLNKVFNFYFEVAVGLVRMQKEQLSGTKHILPNIHTQMSQAVDLFTENNRSVFFGESFINTIEKVSELVKSKPQDAARLIAYLNKLILDMGAHLRGIDAVHFGRVYVRDLKEVRVKAAILNQYSSFSREFDDAYVAVRVDAIDEDATVLVDKSMFSLIMYNLLSNALKYCMPHSEVRFHFSDEKKQLDISMISLRMEQDEIPLLFQEGVRGKHAKTSPGTGVGLFVIKNALKIMGKPLMEIRPNYQKTANLNEEQYVENHFHFDFS